MKTPRLSALLLLAIAGCAAHPPGRSAQPGDRPLPREDPKVPLKRALTALADGQTGTLMALSTFASEDQKRSLQHLVPQALALRELQHALVATFGNAGKLGDDPLPGLLEAVDAATVRFEPDTARVIPPPPTPPYTLSAAGDHWKLDFGRSGLFPTGRVAAADLRAVDDYTHYVQALAKKVRAHAYATPDEAIAALDPHHRAATTQPAPQTAAQTAEIAPHGPTHPAISPSLGNPGPDIPPPPGSPALAPPQ